MTQVQFYHLTATPLERALPKLLEKAYGGGFKVLLAMGSDERLAQLDQLLWTSSLFLPHGSIKDGNAERQPILLANDIEPRNNANLLALIDGTMPDKPQDFERIIDIFDGNDAQAVEKARTRWKNYKNSGHTVTYLRQNDTGAWEQKTVA